MATTKGPLPNTLSYHIMTVVRKAIIRGEFLPGTALREQELEAKYGSSRGPIRESLLILEQKGVVVHTPRRGFRVRAYDDKGLEDLYRLRAALECMVAWDLAQFDVAPLVKQLERCNGEMEVCAEQGDLEGYFEKNIEFHQIMIEYVRNELLARLLSLVNEMSFPIRYRLLSQNFDGGRSLRYHKKIVRKIAGHAFEAAAKLIEVHILENLETAKRINAEVATAAAQPARRRSNRAARLAPTLD